MSTREITAEPSPTVAIQARPRLLGLAYRMLGDMDEAEDVVQEALLRWHVAEQESIRSPEAWLVTVVTRLSINRLRRLETERATYPGPWLPEPIATEGPFAPTPLPDPDRRAEVASDLSVALLLLLERLAPEERAAFLLRDVFETDYSEIARTLERSPNAVRQMVHRARTRVQTERTRVTTPPGDHERLFERFVEALVSDDAEGLVALLAPDVVLASDGGGRVSAARNWLSGPDRVSRLLLGFGRKFGPKYVYQRAYLNGEPALLALLASDPGKVGWSMTLDLGGSRIRAVLIMRNPDKLQRVLGATVSIA